MTPQELRAWRTAMGWTQAEAAQQLGTTKTTVYRYETARRTIPAHIEKTTALLAERKKMLAERKKM